MTQEQLVLLTVKELKALAKENGLKGYSKLRKAELVEVLAAEVVEAEEVSEVQEVQEVLNSYLKGDLTPAIDFTFVENETLSSYEVMHNIEELENVSIIFPATEKYKETKEKYRNSRSEKAWHELAEMQECELEELYDYDNPSEICYNGTFYMVHGGMVIGGDEPKKLESDKSQNKFLIRVNNQIKIIVTTDYKILTESFLIKMQKGLVELLGNNARCDTNFLKQRVSKLTKFEEDDWGNYDFSTENSHGTIKGTTVQFLNI